MVKYQDLLNADGSTNSMVNKAQYLANQPYNSIILLKTCQLENSELCNLRGGDDNHIPIVCFLSVMDGGGPRRAAATTSNSATGSGSGSTVEQGQLKHHR